jgi:hypothetical protein
LAGVRSSLLAVPLGRNPEIINKITPMNKIAQTHSRL